eukprot:6175868-Pleurochrysis_carterae.AAC.4
MEDATPGVIQPARSVSLHTCWIEPPLFAFDLSVQHLKPATGCGSELMSARVLDVNKAFQQKQMYCTLVYPLSATRGPWLACTQLVSALAQSSADSCALAAPAVGAARASSRYRVFRYYIGVSVRVL